MEGAAAQSRRVESQLQRARVSRETVGVGGANAPADARRWLMNGGRGSIHESADDQADESDSPLIAPPVGYLLPLDRGLVARSRVGE